MDPIHFLTLSAPMAARHRPATRQDIDSFYQSDDWSVVWRMRAAFRGVVRFGRRIGMARSAKRRPSAIARSVPAE